MTKLKIVYFGTPDFSAELLKKLAEEKNLPIEIIGVVTQPDKKIGRKQVVAPSPVKAMALELGIPLDPDIKSVDMGLLFAFGDLISNDTLSKPKHGFWNVHPSLLPKYRGPAPIAAPLLNGDVESGVTIIKMDNELDHGPIIDQKKAYIFPLQRRDQLTERLVDLAAEMLGELFVKYAGNMNGVLTSEQDHSKATYTIKLTKEDGYVELSALRNQLSENSKELFNKFRAYYPWPGIWTKVRIKNQELRIKITKIHLEDEKIVIKKVQLEGKNEVSFEEFERAYSIFKV